MRRVLIVAGLIVTTLGTSSCLAVAPPGAHMSPPVAVDDFCTRLAQVTCDGFEQCCDDAATRMAAPDHTRCVQMIQSGCTSGMYSLSTLIHDPRTGYDPFVAGQVIADAERYVATCDPTIVVWAARRDGFERALTGTVGPGGNCVNGNPIANYPALFSCEDLTESCILDTSATRGTCAARLGLHARCFLDFDCGDSMYCAPQVLTSTCEPRLANGGACNHDGSDRATWCQSSFCHAGACATPTRTNVYCGYAVF